MASNCDIVQLIKSTQERIFRLAQRDHGLTLKAISLDSGIPYSTIRSYAGHNGEPAEMPVSALRKLVGVIPNELLSLLLPEAECIVSVPAGVDHDDFAGHCRDYLKLKDAAHHPESELGREIGPSEDKALTGKVVAITARAA